MAEHVPYAMLLLVLFRLHNEIYREHPGESVRLLPASCHQVLIASAIVVHSYSAVMTAFHRVYGDLRPAAVLSVTDQHSAGTPTNAAAAATTASSDSESACSEDDDNMSPTASRLGANRLYTLFHARNAGCIVGPALAAYMLLAGTRYVESHTSAPLFAFQGEKWLRGESFSGRVRRYGDKTFIHTDLHDYM